MKSSNRCSGRNKKVVEIAGIVAFFLIGCLSCDSEKIYREEQYKYVVYLLSGAENVYTESYTLNEDESVRYFSVGVGGSNSNGEEVVVTLTPDNQIMAQYNRNNFDIDVSKFARLLPKNRYNIEAVRDGAESYTVAIPAHPTDQYVKVPVKVRPLGLSPDSIYFIPLAISNVSCYEVNQEKYNLLYRVTIQNDYAEQRFTTLYTSRGLEVNQSSNEVTSMSGAKTVQPLTKDKVRMFAGTNAQSQLTTIADIEKYAITVQIKSDNTVEITPYGTIEVEMLADDWYNRYDPEVPQGLKKYRMFYLYYRYRTKNSNGTYSAWMEVKESLTRVEND